MFVETKTNLNSVHDFGELELEADLQETLVLADGIGDTGLNSVTVGRKIIIVSKSIYKRKKMSSYNRKFIVFGGKLH